MVHLQALFLSEGEYMSPTTQKEIRKRQLIIVMAAAGLLHLLLAALYRGHATDMACFTSWADSVFHNGFGAFYSDGSFTDYPPGYMYVLWVIGGIRSLFSMGYESAASTVLLKLPAMACDLVTGWLLYRLAAKAASHRHGIICMSVYLFSPAVLINSAVWGQVDGILALFAVLMLLLIYEKKLILSYVAFGAGFLIKPQMAFLFPVLLAAVVDQVFLEDFSWKKFGVNLGCGLGVIACMFLLMAPFGVGKVIGQYMETVSSYPYATVNAYNLFAMMGLNWHAQTETVMGIPCSVLGMVLMALVMLFAVVLCLRSRKDRTKYIYAGAFLFIGIFTVSVRMHERYMFPALALLVMLYALRPRARYMAGYIVVSIVHFLNVVHVLFWYDPANFNWENPIPVALGACMTLCFVWLCWQGIREYWTDREPETAEETLEATKKAVEEKRAVLPGGGKKTAVRPVQVETSKVFDRLKAADYILMAAICIVYAIVAFTDLGDRQAPETGVTLDNAGDQMVFAFDDTYDFDKIRYYMGNYHDVSVKIEYADAAEGPWNVAEEAKELSGVFKWDAIDVDFPARYVRITALHAPTSLWELAFCDMTDSQILPVNREEYAPLFDEQQLVPERTTNLNSSYFDEIYHARTAYEYIHGLYSYENTHPPLGKWFISLGIRAFGMNPFGWRFMGCLFGVLMLPVLYLFVRRMFDRTWLAAAVTVLFAVDFMHFAQSRLATIDVFITFFVILMYYFMYRYTALSFYDAPLKKTWIPLGLCGVSMGLGVASKWTGVYAGLGLAVVFFWTLWKRYREYRYARKYPAGETNGISHRTIVQTFPDAAWKTIGFCCIFFIAAPAVIYALSYLPFRDGSGAGWIQEMLKNQSTMFNYHSSLVSQHPYSSRWYQWPLMTRPIWYYSGMAGATQYEGISSFGNPLVWWAGIPAFFYMLYRGIAYRDRKSGFLTVGYLAQYVPWFFVSRTTYIYHYFPCVPFVTLMLAYCFYLFTKDHEKRRYAVFAYVAAAVGLFILFYPVLSGHGVSASYVNSFLRWFRSWQLISAPFPT